MHRCGLCVHAACAGLPSTTLADTCLLATPFPTPATTFLPPPHSTPPSLTPPPCSHHPSPLPHAAPLPPPEPVFCLPLQTVPRGNLALHDPHYGAAFSPTAFPPYRIASTSTNSLLIPTLPSLPLTANLTTHFRSQLLPPYLPPPLPEPLFGLPLQMLPCDDMALTDPRHGAAFPTLMPALLNCILIFLYLFGFSCHRGRHLKRAHQTLTIPLYFVPPVFPMPNPRARIPSALPHAAARRHGTHRPPIWSSLPPAGIRGGACP